MILPNKAKKIKRILFMADLHCGHRAGLTAPEFQSGTLGKKYYHLQVELWDAYKNRIAALKKERPIDICCVVGDAFDGKGTRSGASELIAVEMRRQVDMAIRAIEEVGAKTLLGVYGTAYHVAPIGDDWETTLAVEMKFKKMDSHMWPEVNGLTFDVKHFIGGTSVPYGRGTQLEKDQIANLLWNEVEEQPRGDVFIRAHLHRFHFCGEDHYLAICLPSLQGAATKFGARKCSMPVNFGLVWFDVYPDGSYEWNRDVIRVESQKAESVKL